MSPAVGPRQPIPPPGDGPGPRPGRRLPFPLLLVLLVGLFLLTMNTLGDPSEPEIYFNRFLEHVDAGRVKEVNVQPDRIRIVFGEPVALREAQAGGGEAEERSVSRAFTRIPTTMDQEALQERLIAHGVQVRYVPDSPFAGLLLAWILPLALVVLLWFFLMRSMGRAQSVFSFGKSRARIAPEQGIKTTFDDVAGIDEAKQELREIVDFLKRPARYAALGGKIPKGVLLVGPPGCGKTLIARALAGEAGVPFFSISGSDFVEMFVGVGAARVRDLFRQAQAKAPCIVFIDEIDAVGRLRGAGIGGGHDEREQTLNQLLVEMDGFESEKGTIILAATNRPDVLDPALLRPGRFDRRIVIDHPDQKGRRKILEVHSRRKPLAEDVNLDEIARRTPGFTGADLANVMNEAALLAARRGKDRIERDDVNEAVERVISGPERRSRVIGEREKEILSYHEMGHALVALRSRHADPVHKVSIIPRGHTALGYTLMFPEEDRYIVLREELIDRITGLLGGRSAEKLVFDTYSTGAANDLEKASEIARRMVLKFGMREETGPVSFGRPETEVFLGRDLSYEKNFSEKTAVEIDQAVRAILQECEAAALSILESNRAVLDRLAEEVRAKETLEGEEIRGIVAEMDRLPAEERRRILHQGGAETRNGASPDEHGGNPVEPRKGSGAGSS